MASSGKEDEDLEALLDSAYEDLKKKPEEKPTELPTTEKSQEKEKSEVKDETKNLDDFLSTMEGEFRKLMQANGDDPNAMEDFQKLTAEFQKVAQQQSAEGPSDQMPDFSKFLNGAMGNEPNFDPEQFMNSFGMGQGGTGDNQSDDPSVSMMGALLSQLLSPDLLYPAISQLKERYPEWLRKNKESPDYSRCSQQFAVVEKLCIAYETQKKDPGANNNMNTIVTLVQELQSFGDPPSELLECDEEVPQPQFASGDNPDTENQQPQEECKVQ